MTIGQSASKCESKYERLRKIGIGSYGIVFKCVNRQTGQIVAIKRYSENDSDPIIRKIAMREVRMLRQLRHPNLINLIEVFRRKRKLHLVFDYCELTVLDVIEKYSSNCPLNLVKKIVWQTVNAINYCHLHNCIHRDIKPENILINQSGVVKLCDFGFARTINKPLVATSALHRKQLAEVAKENAQPEEQRRRLFTSTADRQALTEYVATRWYRAPELLIGEIYYDIKIDIWAIGCVTAELMRGEPIWPGKTDLDQLCIIKNSLGQLTAGQTHTLLTQGIYDQANIERLLKQNSTLSESLERKLPAKVGAAGLDFVKLCLQMDPARRPTSEELLRHSFIQAVRMGQLAPLKESAAPGGRRSSGSLVPQPASQGLRNGRLNSQSLMMVAAASSSPSKTSSTSKVVGAGSSRLPAIGGSSIPRAVSRQQASRNPDEPLRSQPQRAAAQKAATIASNTYRRKARSNQIGKT